MGNLVTQQPGKLPLERACKFKSCRRRSILPRLGSLPNGLVVILTTIFSAMASASSSTSCLLPTTPSVKARAHDIGFFRTSGLTSRDAIQEALGELQRRLRGSLQKEVESRTLLGRKSAWLRQIREQVLQRVRQTTIELEDGIIVFEDKDVLIDISDYTNYEGSLYAEERSKGCPFIAVVESNLSDLESFEASGQSAIVAAEAALQELERRFKPTEAS